MNLSCSTRPLRRAVQLFLFFSFILVAAQLDKAQEAANNTKPTSSADESFVVERVRQLEAELERQNNKLDQLQKTINQQQLAIQALLEKLNPEKTETTAVSTTTTATTAGDSNTTEATAQTQPQSTVEQRLSKVEGQVTRIGPFRVSGDFRLRFDGVFRSATEPPDPPLEHVQNARARYRFRLNL